MDVTVHQDGNSITVNTGAIITRLNKAGVQFVSSISIGDKPIARNGKLICTLEDRSDYENKRTIHEEDFESQIDSVTVEQSGPVRAVVKITGKHQSTTGQRAWLPFVVRPYFFAGSDSIRMVHTIIFDGDEQKDFIRGLGIRFDVPLREQTHNRHMRFAGETGIFAEPLQLISGRRSRRRLVSETDCGRATARHRHAPARELVKDIAVGMVETCPDLARFLHHRAAHRPQKQLDSKPPVGTRVDRHCVHRRHHRRTGFGDEKLLARVPDRTGDRKRLNRHLKPHPVALSPESPAMDLRHYDTKGHGLEAFVRRLSTGFSSATGVAERTR